MNVVLYSATGMIGSRVLTELLSRGHRQVPHPCVSKDGKLRGATCTSALAAGEQVEAPGFSPVN
jgi:hypothetical protein